MVHLPYTYYLKWSATGMKYYGVRFAKNCNPKDLWAPYKTSSKYVAQHILEHGDPDIISIRKIFNGETAVSDSRNWENKILKRLNVIHRNDFLNKTDNKSISPGDAGKGARLAALKRRGRTKETHAGVAAQASKLRGRTKETHAGYAAMAEKKRGRTKETDKGLTSTSAKLTGRTKESHQYLKSTRKGLTKATDSGFASTSAKLTGRTKESHPYLMAMSESAKKLQSKKWRIISPAGEIFLITNLSAWCEENNFIRGSVRNNKKYHGYTFNSISDVGVK